MSFRITCRLLSVTGKQDNEKIKKFIKNGRLYDAADVSKNTLLHHAAKGGNFEIVQYLLDSGSQVNARNNLGQTPLVRSLKTNFPCKKVIEILLKAGADIFVKDNLGKSALNIVDSSVWLSEDMERFEIYKTFLENVRDFDDLKLLKTGTEKVIRRLLQTNVDLYAVDSRDNTLVHELAGNRNPGIMTLLRGKSFYINVRGEDGWTPLMCATSKGSVKAIKFLLGEGADIEALANNKQPALYIAYQTVVQLGAFDKRSLKCIQILLQHGANVQIEVIDHSLPTIFDLVWEYQFAEGSFTAGELALAQLALQEANGTAITPLICSKIDSQSRFKTYFEYCQQQISAKIYRSVTLFDILTASDRKLERYLNDKELAEKLVVYQAVDYFDTILRKRVSRAILMVGLRKSAAPVIGELMDMNYDSYPFIADEIISYLEEKDIRSLISSQNKISDDVISSRSKIQMFLKN